MSHIVQRTSSDLVGLFNLMILSYTYYSYESSWFL